MRKLLLFFILLLSVGFSYILFLRKDITLSKEDVKQKYTLPNSHFIKWKDTEIHYTESGEGFPILMIHGFGGSNRDFILLDSLFNQEFRVIRVDLPGFALSDFPETENPTYQNIYNEYFSYILDTLHIDSCYVFGNSLGGLMSWNLAIQQPKKVKKLVLLNSAGYDMPDVIKTANAKVFRNKFFQLALKKGIPKFVTAKGIERVFYDNSILVDEKVQRVNDFWNREGNLQHIINMANSEQYLDEALIKQIACPTLILWGKYDKIVNVKYAHYFKRDIKNSQVIVYDSCGHVPMLEIPNKVYYDITQFLNQ